MTEELVFVTGPTAVGKTAVALRLATAWDAEIISCDSLLFYRGMDIGTAKPTCEELKQVPHHLIDIRPVDQPMDLPSYLREVDRVVRELTRRRKRILIVGGSGFYLQSFFQPVPQEFDPAPGLREELEERVQQKGLADLLAQLDQRHPEGTPGLDRANPHRVINALLRSLSLPGTWETLRGAWLAGPRPFPACPMRVLRLDRPREELDQRIAERTRAMLDQGLVEEVLSLREQGIERNPTARTAIGYREILDQPEAGPDSWSEQISQHTRQLVRKQEKWFRSRFRGVAALHPDLVRV